MPRRSLLVSAFIPLALAGCFLLPKEEQALAPPLIEAPRVTYRTVPVTRGSIEHEVVVTGTYEYTTGYSLSFDYRGGRIARIAVRYGDDVQRGDLVAELEADSLLSDIALQRITVEKAEIALTKRLLEENRLDIRLAELDLEAATIRLRDLEESLARRRVHSPIDGRIVYVAPVAIGELVEAYQVVARVADPSQMLVTYHGDEAELFRIDYPVELGIGSESYRGRVVMTPATAPAELPEAMRNRVLIEPIDVPEELLSHAFIVIRAVLARKDDVIVVPRRGVREYQNSFFVHVLENSVRIERPVETGMETPTHIEIVQGLSEGELLILQ